jgi:hypothetical protein
VHRFKTIYFPGDRVMSGEATRVTVSLPGVDGPQDQRGFANFASSLSSYDFRVALGDPVLEDLEEMARQEDRSLSNTCVRILRDVHANGTPPTGPAVGTVSQQLRLGVVPLTAEPVTTNAGPRSPAWNSVPAPHTGDVVRLQPLRPARLQAARRVAG